ncbi:MAG: DNA phosphorothioation system sulfurtransferase DndC [Nitrospira sp.]|nr:DNA phosphorothioation system sulfurtransferase DndC [Nitrospira sp.]
MDIAYRESKLTISPHLVKDILEELRTAYLGDERPWIVGFSGGKDSTILVQFVYMMLLSIQPEERRKKVFVLTSDTKVEIPSIVERIERELTLLRAAAHRDRLPIEAHTVCPELTDSFWINLIGRGYPSPRPKFRWCTDRLKIFPVSKFIIERVNDFGSVVVVLGSRIAESGTRAQTMASHHIEGQRFRPHSDLPKAWVYTPLEHLSNDDVWVCLLNLKNPWGGDNRSLVALYRRASGGECPLVIDTSTPSCGQSRFGCWVCTVVEHDKSMESLVDDGEERFEPLLDFRDYLREVRENSTARENIRRNGLPAKEDGKGPFTMATRRDLLRRLLLAQKQSGETLIEPAELRAIAEVWSTEDTKLGGPQPIDTVERIWKHIYEEAPMPDDTPNPALTKEEQLLKQVCEERGIPFEMMRRLTDLEEEYGALKNWRRGITGDLMETVMKYAQSEGSNEDV